MKTYNESAVQLADRAKNFIYHPPKEGQPEKYEFLRLQGCALSQHFNMHCPPSRELSLAQTKLEEAIFWANAAIARNETV